MAARQQVVVAAVTSHPRDPLHGDVTLVYWAAAGLPLPSTVTGILRTIKRAMLEHQFGRLSTADMASVGIVPANALGVGTG